MGQNINDGFGDMLSMPEAAQLVSVALAATAAADRAERRQAQASPAKPQHVEKTSHVRDALAE